MVRLGLLFKGYKMTVKINGLTGVEYPDGFKQKKAAILAGSVNYFAMATPPDGWLKAEGQAVSRATYADLFAAIGVSFGVGDGSTTFNLPDMRGEFIRGVDGGRGVDSGRVLGSSQKGSLLVGDMGASNAALTARATSTPNTVAVTDSGWDAVNLADYPNNQFASAAGSAGALNTNTTEQYNGASRPRNVALLGCIKF